MAVHARPSGDVHIDGALGQSQRSTPSTFGAEYPAATKVPLPQALTSTVISASSDDVSGVCTQLVAGVHNHVLGLEK